MGPKVLVWGAFEGLWLLGWSSLFPTLNDRWHPNGPEQQPGGTVSLALGLGGSKSMALRHQAPWDGHLGVRRRVRVSPWRPAGPS